MNDTTTAAPKPRSFIRTGQVRALAHELGKRVTRRYLAELNSTVERKVRANAHAAGSRRQLDVLDAQAAKIAAQLASRPRL